METLLHSGFVGCSSPSTLEKRIPINTTDIGLAAELLNRAVDLVVVVPIGCASMPWIARAMRRATSK